MTQRRRPEQEYREGAYFDPRLDDVNNLIYEMRGEMKHYATKAEIPDLKGYATESFVSAAETRITKWIIGVLLGAIGATATIVYLIVRLVD